MRFLAVDDEKYMLEELEEALRAVRPEAEVISCSSSAEALEAVQKAACDAAFLDIEMLVKGFNSLAVATDTFDCDYYQFLNGDPRAVNQYRNDYLPSYSWAEFRNAEILYGGK